MHRYEIYCHLYGMTTDEVLGWISDVLTTYTHDSELQIITAPSLISALYKSPRWPLQDFPACCVLTSRSLVTAFNNGDSSASSLKSSLNGGSLPTTSSFHRLPYRTDLVVPIVFLITPQHGPRRQHTMHSRMLTVSAEMCLPRRSVAAAVYSWLLRTCCLSTDVVFCLFRDRCPETNVVSEPFATNDCYSGPTVLALSEYGTILSGVHPMLCRDIETDEYIRCYAIGW
jgi:hypothetical protein